MDEQTQQQLVLLAQAYLSGDQLAQQVVQQIAQKAQQGDQQAQQLVQILQQIIQQLQGQQALAYRRGGILNYLKFLRGKCPEGYEMQYFKNGGKAGCKKCLKAQEGDKMPLDPVEEFRCGRKMKKKAACGTKMQKYKDPSGPLHTKKVKLTETDEGYEGESRDKTYFHFTPKTTFVRTNKGEWINSDKHRNRVDSALRANKEIENPYAKKAPSKKANGGSFIPFPNRGLK